MEATSGRIEAKEGERRKKSDYFQRKSCTEKSISVNRDELKCFYINARNILNKFDEFEAWAYDINPDIIGVTESWTGKHILDSELALNGYDLFRQDRAVDREGGGVLLYVRNTLNAVQYTLMSRFPEQVWCYFSDSKGSHFYVGVCYRTPTVNIYGSGNHDLLQDTINELGSTKKHFVLMGDFNYRYLHWPALANDYNTTVEANQFYHCLEDIFLHNMSTSAPETMLFST